MWNCKRHFNLQLQEKYLGKKKNPYFPFVDLEKAFDWVPRNVVWRALRKLGLEKWLVKVVHSMYEHAWSLVKVNGTVRDDSLVNVGFHQVSALTFQTPTPQQTTNCFSVFDRFMGLALKALSHLLFITNLETLEQYRKKLGQDVQKNCFMLMT